MPERQAETEYRPTGSREEGASGASFLGERGLEENEWSLLNSRKGLSEGSQTRKQEAMSGGGGHLKLSAGFVFSSVHFCGKHPRILRPGIASRSENYGVRKTSRSKLFEEGAAFLGASNSGEPIGFVVLHVWREGFL